MYITKRFFATVQNKLHFAISGQTAAEIIHDRANSKKQNMGLTNWKNSPKGAIRKTDVSIAKNYLNEKDILKDSGKISREVAVELVGREYEKYQVIHGRMVESDFDREVKRLLKPGK